MNVISFDKVNGPNGWLGNLSPHAIMFDNKKWNTSEALFQALRFKNMDIREIIRNEKSPMGAKMKAKKYKTEMSITPMSEEDLNNMRTCIKLKFTQNEKLTKLLLATGDRLIIENIGKRKGARHEFWGARLINGKWEGKNVMGNLLMELRNVLSKEGPIA